ncbi:MAG: polysaccharide deacetylase family protein [Desulfovibrio sp.]|nr:polysaccharide deacetylase family protein [Desulfovibrio sp.]
MNQSLKGILPRRAVAVTFDDGYADNLEIAAPIMAQREIPATVFVTTGMLGREFWWHELERLMLHPGRLPEKLHLRTTDRHYTFELGKFSCLDASDFERYKEWTLLSPGAPTPRHAAYRELLALLPPLPDVERRVWLEELRAKSEGVPLGPVTPCLTANAIRDVAHNSLVDFGAHTISHPILSLLPPENQLAEIAQSARDLESLIGRFPLCFSYPYGGTIHYSRHTRDIAEKLGFSFACTTTPGLVGPDVDPFVLPREVVRDWDGATFAAHLDVLFEAGTD